MLLPTTCARLMVRTWPSARRTEAPALKAAWLAAVAGMEKPAPVRQTPLSQSVLVKALTLVETVIDEGEGGAHLNALAVMNALGDAIAQHLDELLALGTTERCDLRYQRMMRFGSNLTSSL